MPHGAHNAYSGAGRTAMPTKRHRRQIGGSARDYEELFASLAA
jgi:hypothetical protein